MNFVETLEKEKKSIIKLIYAKLGPPKGLELRGENFKRKIYIIKIGLNCRFFVLL